MNSPTFPTSKSINSKIFLSVLKILLVVIANLQVGHVFFLFYGVNIFNYYSYSLFYAIPTKPMGTYLYVNRVSENIKTYWTRQHLF